MRSEKEIRERIVKRRKNISDFTLFEDVREIQLYLIQELEWVLSSEKKEELCSEPTSEDSDCIYPRGHRGRHSYEGHGQEVSPAPKEKRLIGDLTKYAESGDAIRERMKEVSREEKPRLLDREMRFTLHEKGERVFTLLELVDLMEKLERTNEFEEWKNELELIPRISLITVFLKEYPNLVKKILEESK